MRIVEIGEAFARFLTSPVMVIVGSRDAAFRAEIGRAVGVRVAGDAVELMISRWQWPGTAANLSANGALAATFARPTDYVTCQLKGRATVREAAAVDRALAAAYVADVTAALCDLGLVPGVITPWLCDRDLVVARFAVAEAYTQTPGARAGAPLEAAP